MGAYNGLMVVDIFITCYYVTYTGNSSTGQLFYVIGYTTTNTSNNTSPSTIVYGVFGGVGGEVANLLTPLQFQGQQPITVSLGTFPLGFVIGPVDPSVTSISWIFGYYAGRTIPTINLTSFPQGDICYVKYNNTCPTDKFPDFCGDINICNGKESCASNGTCVSSGFPCNATQCCSQFSGCGAIGSSQYCFSSNTSQPTVLPTEAPTSSPTSSPTERPTNAPTVSPTAPPTERPTSVPTEAPTSSPTERPTPGVTQCIVCTFTQGGYGSKCTHPRSISCSPPSITKTTQPGCLRDACVKSSIILGNATIGYTVTFTSPSMIQRYLPAGGKPGIFTLSETNPQITTAGILAGQLLTATLNQLLSPNTQLAFSTVCTAVAPIIRGLTVTEVIYIANQVISGANSPLYSVFTPSILNEALSLYNEVFEGCKDAGPILCFDCATTHQNVSKEIVPPEHDAFIAPLVYVFVGVISLTLAFLYLFYQYPTGRKARLTR